jgi:oligopeptide transport system substrate-binding protein
MSPEPVPPPDPDEGDDSAWEPVLRPPGRITRVVLVVLAVAVALGGAVWTLGVPPGPTGGEPAPRDPDVDVRIVGGAPATWDPALAADAGTAATLAQVYEGLTALDTTNRIQPALAREWHIEDGGRRVVFELRPGVRFSDGTPIRGDDVVASWLRLLDPERPGPLASLLGDVVGAREYLAGTGSREEVGLTAAEGRVTVELRRPASFFVAAAASPSLAVVPPGQAVSEGAEPPPGAVVSGAYVPVMTADGVIRLTANPAYWAGPPNLDMIDVVTDVGGRSLVAEFESGDVDYTEIGEADTTWIRYDRSLGPALRRTDALVVDLYGFDTTRPPFDDVQVRRAFATAVDWERLATLASEFATPATSLVPVGVPGRSADDFTLAYDPDAARRDLAAAGYAGGRGFPATTLRSHGSVYDEAVAEGLSQVLDVTIAVEVLPFDEYNTLLDVDPPSFWTLSWSADYPHPHDFLGLLLETGSTSNEGRWSDAAFDAALTAAAATTEPAEQERLYAEAQVIVREEVPIIPVSYRPSWALGRDGLVGAQPTGMGIIRFASLDRPDR